ncbi:MAG: rhomboid family intramembrane serine protease [Methylobacterium sp.]|uniref:rhomboid family intramembrane serine protease n=1 Tax=unclassified Methylobacterium TaxID=2615210 RepID=UPI0011CB69B2|nr:MULTISPECIES: rhomboid family intramembrane serine protease [unclassified Methylobacterium]MDO9425736.1 rhomboid family intramembrane serine protease [Methylobacterium sp.]TXM69217.1 rhomboid family intramembrane serine protease [Methylobacterium sp. WL69]
MDAMPDLPPQNRVPMFNMPGVVTVSIAVLLAIHALREFVLPDAWDIWALIHLALIPGRWSVAIDPSRIEDLLKAAAGAAGDPEVVEARQAFARYIAAEPSASPWTFATYALLHGSWTHVIFNSVWLAAFGSPVARRYGVLRYGLVALAGAVAGGVLHVVLDPLSTAPLIGASAGVSALMAAAARFVFQPPPAYAAAQPWQLPPRQRLQTIPELLRNRTAVMFLGIWLVTNFLFGIIALPLGAEATAVAWDAHLGGFLVGFFMLPLVDRHRG